MCDYVITVWKEYLPEYKWKVDGTSYENNY